MTRSRLGLLGLCAMVLGLMAFGAAGAQAEGTWLILNTLGQVKTGSELPAILELEKDKNKEGVEHYVLHSKIIGIAVLFLCKEIKAINAKIFGAGAIGKGPGEEKESKVLFSGCKTFLNGGEAVECEPKDKNAGAGEIVTENGHALAALHNGTDIVKVLPDSTVEHAPFAVIEMSAACPIGTKVPVIGELALKDCENLALTHLVRHLVEPLEALTKLWTISLTAEHVATLLGSAWAKLGGETHKGLAWSISGL